MQDKQVTGELLVYYSELAAHHRVMMIGFGTVYFAINQILILTPAETFSAVSKRFPMAIVVSGGLLTIFVIAATLHHACHFCSSAAMKAVMATETHYQHLPKSIGQLDTFQKWAFRTAKEVRTFIAVPTASAYIVCTIFGLLVATNSYIFTEIGKSLISGSHVDTAYLFGAFILAQATVAIYYTTVFWKHLRYLRLAKNELAMVLRASTRDQFDRTVEDMAQSPISGSSKAFQLDQGAN